MPPYASANQNIITIYQGCDYIDTITVTHPDGSPFDLTDCQFESVLRSFDGELAATFDCQSIDVTSGVITRKIDNAATKLLTPNLNVAHVWGVQITDPDGEILPEIQGGALVVAEVV